MSRLGLWVQESHSLYDHIPTQEDFINDLQWPLNRSLYPEDHKFEASGRDNGKINVEEEEYKDEEESEKEEEEWASVKKRMMNEFLL